MGKNRLVTTFMFIAVFSLFTTLFYDPPNAFAADPYVDFPVIFAGEYGNPVSLTSGAASATAVIGLKDNTFIQLALDNEIIVKFDDNLAFQSCDERPDLRIHTFDTIFPANADVSVSDDGITWYLVGENVPDTNPEFFVDIDLDATDGVPQSISYVKLLTTYEDPTYPKLGFDLDAVEALFTEDQLCLPPPPPQECVEHVIDFGDTVEGVCPFDSSDWISIGGTSVLLQVGTPEYTSIPGWHSSSPDPGILVTAVPLHPGHTVTVGNPAESFRSNGIGDQPEPDNPEDNMCFFSDDSTFGRPDPTRGDSSSFYYLTFDNPITSLSLDLFDYADDTVYGGAFEDCNGGTDFCNIGAIATLTAFANDDFTNPVGTATYEVDASSATLTLSAPDIGTGIDNITFCEDTTAPPLECTELDTVDFENFGNGAEITTQYQANGAHFSSDTSVTKILDDSGETPKATGGNILVSNIGANNGDIIIDIVDPTTGDPADASKIEFSLFSIGNNAVTVESWDSDDNLLDTQVFQHIDVGGANCNYPEWPNGCPGPITNGWAQTDLYSFDDPNNEIRKVTVTSSKEVDGDGYGIDDLQITLCDGGVSPTEITTISGMKFEDMNGDGDKAGDSGIENWEITLDCDNDALDAMIATDVAGNYDFSFDLVVGDSTSCTLTENTDDADWSNSTPISIGPFDVAAGDVITGQDFGNYQPISLNGMKFEDTNANGVHDEGEPGLQGVIIDLTGTDGMGDAVTATETTNVDGEFWFEDLVPGTYIATENVPTGYVPTTPTSTDPQTLVSGEDLELGYVFGNVKPFSAEKTWTHTDYNWGEICEIIDEQEVCRPANIDTDDVLADPLDVIDDEFILLGNANKKGFQNTNPGAFFALTTVDVNIPVDSLTVVEMYDDCTVTTVDDLDVPMLELLGSKKNIETALKAAIADPNGDVTEISSKDIVTSMDVSSATVVIPGPIDAESTVYVLVKFSDALSGQDVTLPVSCENQEDVIATIDGEVNSPFEVIVNAILTIIEK
jgi:hypothetical protein